MFILMLVAYLHMSEVKPQPMALFKTEVECVAAARKANGINVNDSHPPEGLGFVCYGLVHPT